MKPITQEFGNLALTLKQCSKNKAYKCKEACWNIESCDLKKKLPIKNIKNSLTATEVILNVRNISNKGWRFDLGSFELIDTEGYAYRAFALCDEHYPSRMVSDSWTVSPGTQVDFLFVFPEIDEGRDVSCILMVMNTSIINFKINEMSPSAKDLFSKRKEFPAQDVIFDNFELSQLNSNFDRLELDMFTRLNTMLGSKEAIMLENNIKREMFSIEQQFKNMDKETKLFFESKLKKLVDEYNSNLNLTQERENKNKKLDQKVSQLYELTPREFEEYNANLLEALGYKVHLTPESNDKGIDIFAEKAGLRIAVQCKKYKGVVGSPDIQKFIGSIQHAEVHKGLFITTGIFSIEAEKMAMHHPIELIDKLALTELIKKALSEKA